MQPWINDRSFATTAIFTEFYDPAVPLPPHQLVVNAIGDAELCHQALVRAQELVARVSAPVINPPALVATTRRADVARRLAGVPGVITPHIASITRAGTGAEDILENYRRALAGKPLLNAVDPARGY